MSSVVYTPEQVLQQAVVAHDGELELEFHSNKHAKAFRAKMNLLRRNNPDRHEWHMLNLSVRGNVLRIENLTPVAVRKVNYVAEAAGETNE